MIATRPLRLRKLLKQLKRNVEDGYRAENADEDNLWFLGGCTSVQNVVNLYVPTLVNVSADLEGSGKPSSIWDYKGAPRRKGK